MPKSASAGILYDLPMGVVARLTGQYVERAPDATELFSKGVHDATETFEIGNPVLTKDEGATPSRSASRGRRATSASTRRSTTPSSTASSSSSFTGAKCDDTLASCGAGTRARPDRVPAARRHVLRRRDAGRSYDVGRIWRGMWGIDGQYDFVHATFDDAAGGNVPRMPPHRAGAGVLLSRQQLVRARRFLHAFDQNKIGDNETPTRATPC